MTARKATAKAAKPRRQSAASAATPRRARAASAAKPSAKAPAKPPKRAAKAAPAPRAAAKRAPAKPPKSQVVEGTTSKGGKPVTRKAAAPKLKGAKPKPTSRPRGAVAAVRTDLGGMPPEVQSSAEAATALAMASRLDSGDGSPSECAKALLAAMAKLRAMAPPEKKKGALHDIKSGRALRLAPGGPAGTD
jgi:hypothetical protein